MGRNFAAYHSRFVSVNLRLKSLFVELIGEDGQCFSGRAKVEFPCRAVYPQSQINAKCKPPAGTGENRSENLPGAPSIHASSPVHPCTTGKAPLQGSSGTHAPSLMHRCIACKASLHRKRCTLALLEKHPCIVSRASLHSPASIHAPRAVHPCLALEAPMLLQFCIQAG
jgi:hypothetical protein